jgi:hypothetical protein
MIRTYKDYEVRMNGGNDHDHGPSHGTARQGPPGHGRE